MKKTTSRRDFLRTSALTGSLFLIPGAMTQLTANNGRKQASLPDTLSEEKLREYGLLDVTKAPYLADPSGKTDSTKAIQLAVNEARNQQMVCFFPSGTYVISDTISCEQRVAKLAEPRHTDGQTQSYWEIATDKIILIGSTKGPRPVIKIAENAPAFDDPSKTKLAIWIWAQTRHDVPGTSEPKWGAEQPNISFGHVLRNIDIDVRGHAGAIGLRHAGSQGSYLMDCKVYAEGAYAGFNNCPGQGGGTYHIEVEGGKYGLVADPNYRFPMIAGSSFTGQTDASIKYTGIQVPMVLAGCLLESKGNSAVDLTTSGSHAGLSMIDCLVKVGTGGVVARADSKQNVFLENVSVTGATSIQVNETTIADPTNWTNIQRYSCCEARAQNLVNGEVTTETFVKMEKMGKAPDHSVNYDKHWSRIPSFEDTDAANVKDFGALGNGTGDDSAAFKKAMAASDKVFVPKGTYKLSEPLVLGAKTKLFSIRSASIDAPSITTVDDPNATTEVYFISTRSTFEWKAGKGVCGFARGAKISGNGGGRFFGAGGFSKLEGTNQPIKIYSLNVERRSTNPQSSIVNCSNVSVFYFKSEATVKGFGVGVAENTGNTPMGIVNSKNIRVYGVCGNIATAEQRPVMQITNCENVLISQIKSFQTGDFPQVNETRGDQNYAIPSNKAVALFIRE